jgi:hypothetical protein
MAATATKKATAKAVEHKPTLKWVDSICARYTAKGMKPAEVKERRKALITKHGITA